MEIVEKLAPAKNKRIKRNTQEWFDGNISEKLIIRDKLFKMCEKSRLHADKEIYKTAQNSVQNLIVEKKKELFENKFSDSLINLVDV